MVSNSLQEHRSWCLSWRFVLLQSFGLEISLTLFSLVAPKKLVLQVEPFRRHSQNDQWIFLCHPVNPNRTCRLLPEILAAPGASCVQLVLFQLLQAAGSRWARRFSYNSLITRTPRDRCLIALCLQPTSSPPPPFQHHLLTTGFGLKAAVFFCSTF